ncbi:Putative secreted protein with PEP-CTERM sorting signal [Rubrivivax sp. A210]|uniref:hypothetical protein n=1 Tax=Rubrivivax sp. A210 TaxID=2772301 RepID=UPI0019195358|nr:hypothetical protein [Rubrivivax sp. A210]CAD5370565.1 Putative secreted protein with PEP-CTERM sorting signal [Rubrivivax sp. A210]
MEHAMKLSGSLAVAATLGTLAAPSAFAVGVLLGSGTLNTPGDLTRIQVGPGVLEFLDLSVTRGSTVAAAVNTYAPFGFHWAKRVEVSDLFDAFGITYASQANSVVSMAATVAQRSSFIDQLGSGSVVLGWLDDLTTASAHTYTCVSINAGCSPDVFSNNSPNFWPTFPGSSTGVYLVRAVPEAPTWAAMLGGLAGLALLMRRRWVGV